MSAVAEQESLAIATSGARPESIARLCSRCFPWGMRWAPMSGFRTRWWAAACSLERSVCITAHDGDSLAGFCLLVFDEIEFRDRVASLRPTLMERAAALPHVPKAKAARRAMEASAQPLQTQPTTERPRPRAWVEIIAADPDLRGRGVAGKLLQEAERLARERGSLAIEAMTAVWNRPAQRLFEKNDYAPVEIKNGQVILSNPFEHGGVEP